MSTLGIELVIIGMCGLLYERLGEILHELRAARSQGERRG